MTESERREVEPLVEGMILAWHERRENEMYDKMLASLERRYPGMHDMMLASYESFNHASRESARPQPEGVGGIYESDNDIKTLVKCFKGNEDNAIKFWKAINQMTDDIDKTDLVNQLVKEGQINKNYKFRPLFRLLKKYKLYGLTEPNWYYHIK